MQNEHPYPYPRLGSGLSDYKPDSVFECDINCESAGSQLVVKGRFTLKDEAIEGMIKSGMSRFCIRIFCIATNTSEIETNEGLNPDFRIVLPKKRFADRIIIVPGIVMMTDCPDYRNDNLSDDYRNTTVMLRKGNLIAECDGIQIDLDYEDPFEKTESICRIIEGDRYSLDSNGDYLMITLPHDLFNDYRAIWRRELSKVAATMIVVPAIQQVIQQYWFDENQSETPTQKWYYSIDEKIKKLYGNDLRAFPGLDANKVAVTLLSELICDSTKFIAKNYRQLIEGENDYYD